MYINSIYPSLYYSDDDDVDLCSALSHHQKQTKSKIKTYRYKNNI